MTRVKSIVGWALRGGDQTRAEFASQGEAIRDLQQRLAQVDALTDGVERLEAELRTALGDIVERIEAVSARVDALDARCSDHDALLTSLTRVVAPPVDE